MKRLLSVLFITILLSAAVVYAVDYYTYSDVKTIMNTNGCIGCHQAFGTYNTMISMTSSAAATSGLFIVNPAKPDSSVIIWRLEGKMADGTPLTLMPMGGDKLPDAKILVFRDWIEQGAVETFVGVDDTRTWGDIKRKFK